VLIVTDHSAIDYDRVCRLSPLMIDTRNACAGHPLGATRKGESLALA
jgi:hypothetical protein